MKANELMIGNLVYAINRRGEVHLPNETTLKILQIGLFNSEVLPQELNPATEEKWFKITNSDLSPIPLTEEWLLKFGLLKTKEGSFLLGSYEVVPYEDCYRVIAFHGIISTLKYVHHLQNLYWCLVGQELTINP